MKILFNKLLRIFFGLVCSLVLSWTLRAEVYIDKSVIDLDISNSIDIANVPRNFHTPSNLTKAQFQHNENNTLKLGYKNNKTLLRFSVTNQSAESLKRYLYFNSINGHLKLFRINNNSTLEFIGEGGTDIPKLQRPGSGVFNSIEINFDPLLNFQYLLEITSRHNVNYQVFISDKSSLEQKENDKTSFMSFYTGGILLLLIYNFFVFLFLKDKVYIYYCLYAFSFMLASLAITGSLDNFLPNHYFSFSHYLICFSSLSILCATLFTYYFLEVPRLLTRFKKYFYFYVIISSIIFISGLIPAFDQVAKFFGLAIDFVIVSGLFFFIFVAIKLYKVQKLSRFYLFSWAIVLFFVVAWFGMSFGLIKNNFITQNALPIGSMLEMLTLSIALAYKIQTLNEEKILALRKARDKDRYARLVRVLSHDVANSLTVVNSYAKKLLRNENLDKTTLFQLDKVFQGTENIKNILKVVRHQEINAKNEDSIDFVDVNVLEAITFSTLLYEDALLKKNISLDVNISPVLTIKADRTCFINNILNNLISNSIKFSPPNSVIELYSTDSQDYTYLVIKDNGVGIEPELINDIFFTNKTVSTSGTHSEIGHGLGSSLIREYMILFGGKLQVSSLDIEKNPIGHGTTVQLLFPKN
ncbi:MAG: sensor histidine kinase [Bacteriovoracaceae bacterium]|nr:sensor histidine kinase [Bacteriovoracaceae bacterium]